MRWNTTWVSEYPAERSNAQGSARPPSQVARSACAGSSGRWMPLRRSARSRPSRRVGFCSVSRQPRLRATLAAAASYPGWRSPAAVKTEYTSSG
ncbi:hypothetical protein SGLAM104S_10026 [Streptomyces glaucescens]